MGRSVHHPTLEIVNPMPLCYRRTMVVPADTTVDSAELHQQAVRQIGIDGRLRIALELSDLTHSLAIAGIRRRRPECSHDEARQLLAELLYARAASPE